MEGRQRGEGGGALWEGQTGRGGGQGRGGGRVHPHPPCNQLPVWWYLELHQRPQGLSQTGWAHGGQLDEGLTHHCC